MANVDEILADPAKALDLPDGCIPIHVVVLCEYARPGAETRPSANGLATVTDDDMAPWTSIGMLRFAAQLELNAVGDSRDDDE